MKHSLDADKTGLIPRSVPTITHQNNDADQNNSEYRQFLRSARYVNCHYGWRN